MKLFSNEIVFRGHPDKVADQISDALLVEYLKQDNSSRCAIEVVGGKGVIFVTGEVKTNAVVNVEEVVIKQLQSIGYPVNYEIINNIGVQSAEIALGTDTGGAGDNGMMFGYATNETPELLPKAMVILQRFSKLYDELRQNDTRFKPDGKVQITGVYNDDFELTEIKTITICYNNTEVDRAETDKILIDMVDKIALEYDIKINEYLVNPTGKFEIGGFEADTGLTGRKIVVDTYHSFANVGGGAFSGKDPSKVDRSGAYKARELAKRLLVENDLKWCEIQLSYAIGIKEPLAIYINSNKGQLETDASLYAECTPERIISDLGLLETNYVDLAAYGHFRD